MRSLIKAARRFSSTNDHTSLLSAFPQE
jgi:mitochondrial translocator assembly and maintenance protein 41